MTSTFQTEAISHATVVLFLKPRHDGGRESRDCGNWQVDSLCLFDSLTDVVGSVGPAGLTALKSLREEGFDAVAFERREAVGGLWAYSHDPEYTSALDDTTANISKFVVSRGRTLSNSEG